MFEYEPTSYQSNAEMDRARPVRKKRTRNVSNQGGSVNCHFALQHKKSGKYYIGTKPRTELHSFSSKLRDAMVCNKMEFIIKMAMNLRGHRWSDYYQIINIKVRKVDELDFVNNRHPNWKDRIEGVVPCDQSERSESESS